MMAFIRKLLGMSEHDLAHQTAKDELEEAKRQLEWERGLYNQALLRVDVNSRNLMRTWESAAEMMGGSKHAD